MSGIVGPNGQPVGGREIAVTVVLNTATGAANVSASEALPLPAVYDVLAAGQKAVLLQLQARLGEALRPRGPLIPPAGR